LREGRPYRKGDLKVSTSFGKVLEAIGREGPSAFYGGALARSITQDMSTNGGLIDEEDLLGYRVEVRKPVKGTYRGYEVHAMPPPSLGGTAIIELLNIFEDMDLAGMGLNSADSIAAMAKALSLVLPDLKKQVGDPSFVRVNSDRLTSKEYASKLWFS